MTRFIHKLTLFTLPFIVLFGIPAYFFATNGEFASVENVIARSKNNDILFGQAYHDENKHFKAEALKSASPEIVAIGTSRVMGFRSSFFTKSFYNAGGLINNPKNFLDLPSLVPAKTTKVILLGLDPYFLDPAWNRAFVLSNRETDEPSWKVFLRHSWRLFYKDLASGRFSLTDLLYSSSTQTAIGIRAHIEQSGFRNDGSYTFGNKTADVEALAESRHQIEHEAENVRNGGYFEFGTTTDTVALSELDYFLSWAKESNITVVGFSTPFAVAIHEEIKKKPDVDHIRNTDEELLESLFKKYGFIFYDASDPRTVGGSDNEMFEYMHAGEKLYARIIEHLAQRNALQNLVDWKALNEIVKKPSNF